MEINLDGAPGKNKHRGSPKDSLAKCFKHTSTKSTAIDANVKVGTADLDVNIPGATQDHSGSFRDSISSHNGINDISTLIATLHANLPDFKESFYKAAFPHEMQLFSQLDHNENIDQDNLYAVLWMVEDLLKNGATPATIIEDLQEFASKAGNMSIDAFDDNSVSSFPLNLVIKEVKHSAIIGNEVAALSSV